MHIFDVARYITIFFSLFSAQYLCVTLFFCVFFFFFFDSCIIQVFDWSLWVFTSCVVAISRRNFTRLGKHKHMAKDFRDAKPTVKSIGVWWYREIDKNKITKIQIIVHPRIIRSPVKFTETHYLTPIWITVSILFYFSPSYIQCVFSWLVIKILKWFHSLQQFNSNLHQNFHF